MKPIENGVYKFDSAFLAAKAAKALGNNSKTSIAKAFQSRKVEIKDGAELNIEATSLMSKALSNRRCCKTPAKSEVNQTKKNEDIKNQKSTLMEKEKSLQKDPGLHRFQLAPELQGLSLKPEDADSYMDVLEFDGVGKIIGAKRQLLAGEVEAIKNISVAPLNSINSTEERTHSKTPVESLLYFNNFLENVIPNEVVVKWQGNIREFWLRGNISQDRLKSLYQLALNDFSEDHIISREIVGLLADLEKEKYPAQLYDNMFGRIFSSEFGRELVENPSKESLETARMIADQIKQDTANFTEHGLATIAYFLQNDHRFWFPKCPSLKVFMDKPSPENLINCLSKVDNGFDVIKISKLLTCALITKSYALAGNPYLLTKNYDHGEEPYLSKANEFYRDALLNIRTGDDLIDTNLMTKNIYNQYEKMVIKQDEQFKTNSYGSKLRFHPRNERNETDFIYSTSVPDKSSIKHEKISTFEKNLLRSGQSFGVGISGTTNLSCFFYEGMAKKNDKFSKDQAFLNTLAFILYDGGHSISESMAVFKAVSYIEQASFKNEVEKHNKGKEIIESSLVNYKDLVKCGNSESQKHTLNSLNRAYDEMTKSYDKYAYSAIRHE